MAGTGGTTTAGFVGAAGTFALTAVGGYFFGPVGYAAGALAGSFLFGQSGPGVDGPRMGDLEVASSTYGSVIPIGFATQRVAGAMIWATNIREVKSTKNVGGGLLSGLYGGGTDITEYHYYADFAVSFGEGPAGAVRRIWAADTKIADLRRSAGHTSKNPKYQFRIYLGTEDQEPDPTIRNAVASNACPAFRGLTYVVFKNFPIDEFGSIPPIVAEIAWNGDADPVENSPTLVSGSVNTKDYLIDPDRNRLFAYIGTTDIARINMSNMTEEVRRPVSELTAETFRVDGPVDLAGNFYTLVTSTAQRILKVNGDTLKAESETSTGTNQSYLETGAYYGLDQRKDFVMAQAFSNGVLRLYLAETMTLWWTSDTLASRARGLCRGYQDFARLDFWATAAPTIVLGGDTATNILGHVKIESPSIKDPFTGQVHGLSVNYITLDAADFGLSTFALGAPAYDEQNDNVILRLHDGSSNYHMAAYNEDTGIVWQVAIDADWHLPSRARYKYGLIWLQGNQEVVALDADTGEIVFQQSGFTPDVDSGLLTYDGDTDTLYSSSTSGFLQIVPGRASEDAIALSTVVTRLVSRVGLTPSDIDVSELTDEVKGFGIARQISLRGALELLAATYSFEAVESDYLLKFRKRGRSVSRVITEGELVPLNDDEIIREARTQEVDLPVRFTVNYQDYNRNSDIGTQSAKRLQGPDASMYSQNAATLDLPITLTAEQAMEVVLRQLYSAWLERTTHEWHTSWEHADLEPGDVVTLAMDDGIAYTVRLIECALGQDLQLVWRSVVQDSTSYTVNAVEAEGDGYLEQIDPTSSAAKLFVLDVPLLVDADDVNRQSSGFYWGAGAYVAVPWRAAVIYTSDDGAVFLPADEVYEPVTWGSCLDALPDTDTPHQTDRTSSIRVQLTGAGTLSSATELQVLNGANRAWVITADGNAELIGFANVTLGGDGLYTLDTFLRGLRGTEIYAGDHAVGDQIVIISSTTVQRVPLALSKLDTSVSWKVVGRGGLLRDATPVVLTFEGQDLMPYAPSHIVTDGSSWGSDIDITWVRRTRVGGEWVDEYAIVPIGEDEEAYEVDILDGPESSTVLRTISSLTSETTTYTTAMQGSDFGMAQTELHVAVYQISAQAGRGFPGYATLDVS